MVPSPRPGPAFDLATVIDRLAAAGCVAPEEEAGELVRAGPDRATIERWITRRERGEPLAWIVGSAPFCGRTAARRPRRLRPPPSQRGAGPPRRRPPPGRWAGGRPVHRRGRHRRPHLQRGAVGHRGRHRRRPPRRRLCGRNGVAAVAPIPAAPLRPAAFDVVTAVAPYVPTDELHLLPADVPAGTSLPVASMAAAMGSTSSAGVIGSARRLLRPGDWLLVELGGRQDQELHDALDTAGFTGRHPWFDDDGDLRGIAAQAAAVHRGDLSPPGDRSRCWNDTVRRSPPGCGSTSSGRSACRDARRARRHAGRGCCNAACWRCWSCAAVTSSRPTSAIEALWPVRPPRDPAAALHNHLFRLRRACPTA